MWIQLPQTSTVDTANHRLVLTTQNTKKIRNVWKLDKTHEGRKLETNPSVVGRGGFAMSKTAIVSLVKVEATLQKAKLNTFFLS